MSDALKRRCMHLYIDYPEKETEMEIVRLKLPGFRKELLEQLIDTINKLRKLDLKKKPCISETLDWAKSLVALQTEDLSKEVVINTLNVICKYKKDVDLVIEQIDQVF